MSLSRLPLSYCTNVHPGRDVTQVVQGIRDHAIPTRRLLGNRLAAGLWLPASALRELRDNPASLESLREALAEGDLVCYTLNTFPYGDFHSERVKEQVYVPDWSDPQRLEYTIQSAELLAAMMPEGTEGSLSTVPLGFKGFTHPVEFESRCIAQLLELARRLDELHDETGRVLRLAIEPEPCCILETTAEAIGFFERLFRAAESHGCLAPVRRHIGICYDVCHQAVEFERISDSIAAIDRAGIRINKLHITCAIHLEQPGRNPEALRQLAEFAEPRYLHQTFARLADGQVRHVVDLTREFCEHPLNEFAEAQAWRIHFHVPVHRDAVGALGTTRPELEEAIAAVHALDYAPHLEVETYTWGVLPGEKPTTLSSGLVQELRATQELVRRHRPDNGEKTPRGTPDAE